MAEVKNKKLIVDLLNKDLQDEHGAIIQYLYHAWTLDLPGISDSLESIAREEMYHYQWLSRRISELGGDPSIGRSPVYFEAPSFKELISLNVKIENEAIAQYEKHIEEVTDETTQRLLKRILHDEKVHREQFVEMAEQVAEMEQEAEEEPRTPESEAKRQKLFDMLNQSVKEEYTAVLQYLHQAYTAKDAYFGHTMEQNAVTEMKHMGWLAEEVAERGGSLEVERDRVKLEENKADMIKADLDDEMNAIDAYQRRSEATEDEEVRELFDRVRFHEEVHRDDLKELLEEAVEETQSHDAESPEGTAKPKQRRPSGGLTVGSLLENKGRD